jgi:putative sigma-54 modulation protein
MDVKITAVHFTADQKLEAYLQQKLDKLDTFYDRIIGAEVFLRLENEGAPVKDKVVEIKLAVPGQTLFAKDTDRTFEKAADEVVENLRRQIKKHKEKIQAK